MNSTTPIRKPMSMSDASLGALVFIAYVPIIGWAFMTLYMVVIMIVDRIQIWWDGVMK